MKIAIIIAGICLLMIWGSLGRIWVLFRRETKDGKAKKNLGYLLLFIGVLGSLCFIIPLLIKTFST
ncbi:MAG: hypothetical protein D4R64_06895 [Porphyromonadaceae bacterium]|nr:MAG: hypothetical protein D4R64_06895 [Porphyromonadaceae bacterium]